jgi:hypothetical protein
MLCTHVLNRGGQGVHSSPDLLRKGLSAESRGTKQAEASARTSEGELAHALEVVTHQAVTVATRHWRFLVMPAGKGFMQVSLNKS